MEILHMLSVGYVTAILIFIIGLNLLKDICTLSRKLFLISLQLEDIKEMLQYLTSQDYKNKQFENYRNYFQNR